MQLTIWLNRDSGRVITTFLDCLKSKHEDVRAAALEMSVHFFQAAPMPEQQDEILAQLADLGAGAHQKLTEAVGLYLQTM